MPRSLLVFAALLLAGCAAHDHGEGEHATPWAGVERAVAVIHPTEGNQAMGWVRFEQQADGVHVTASISGLTPGAKHGFHIHQFGDCTGADGKTAGGHYNPQGHEHGGPGAEAPHAGDLGNLEADEAGQANYEAVLAHLSVAELRNPIVGRGVIVHAGEDDLTSQPTGAAGARIGCGVIGVAK